MSKTPHKSISDLSHVDVDVSRLPAVLAACGKSEERRGEAIRRAFNTLAIRRRMLEAESAKQKGAGRRMRHEAELQALHARLTKDDEAHAENERRRHTDEAAELLDVLTDAQRLDINGRIQMESAAIQRLLDLDTQHDLEIEVCIHALGPPDTGE